MKHFILIAIIAMSIKVHSETTNPSEKSKINGCERYEGILDSLNKDCNLEAIKILMKQLDTPFEEKLIKELSDSSFVNLVRKTSIGEKNALCPLPHFAEDIDKPGMKLTDLAAKKFCSDALVIIGEKVSAKDYAEGIKDNFFEEYLKVGKELDANKKEDMDKITQMNKTLNTIATRIKEDCTKGIKESCEAKGEFVKLNEKITTAANEEEKNDKFLDSPEYIIRQACPLKFELERYEAILKNEKKVGKIAGTVSAKTLHNVGAMIVATKPKLDMWKKAYLKKTKHEINLKSCLKSDYFTD